MTDKTRLNIGCGHRTMPGYINADANGDLPGIDLVCFLDKIPLDDNSMQEVFASHCIEHVSVDGAKVALREWLRVLQPGGVAVIDTPNIQRNAALYLNGGWERDFNGLTEAERKLCSFQDRPNKTLWLNFKCFSSDKPYDTHFWNADPELLTSLCLDAGFSHAEVAQTEPSLIVKATK